MPAKKSAASHNRKRIGQTKTKQTEAASKPRLATPNRDETDFTQWPTWHQRINRVRFQLTGLAMRVGAIDGFFGELDHFNKNDGPNESEVFGLSAMASEAVERLEKIIRDLDTLSDMALPEMTAYELANRTPRTA